MHNEQKTRQAVKQNEQNPLHRVLRSFWGDDLGFLDDSWRNMARLERQSNISLSEDDKRVYIEAALPGLQEKEIEVTLERGILWIQGKKQEEETDRKYHYKAKSSYAYQIALPDSVDETREPEAKYEKGVLHVTFQKVQGGSAKRIQIKGS